MQYLIGLMCVLVLGGLACSESAAQEPSETKPPRSDSGWLNLPETKEGRFRVTGNVRMDPPAGVESSDFPKLAVFTWHYRARLDGMPKDGQALRQVFEWSSRLDDLLTAERTGFQFGKRGGANRFRVYFYVADVEKLKALSLQAGEQKINIEMDLSVADDPNWEEWRKMRRQAEGASKDANRLLYEKLSKLAEQGNSEAQYHVGMMLNNGLGVNRDLPKAFEWFQKAAAAGDPLAAYKVGCFWGGQFPDVVSIDEQKSLEYELIAAKAGYDLAQHDVALWYYKQKKFDEALRWLKLSAEQGSDSALFGLSSLYREGKVVPQDSVLAYTYFMLGKAESRRPFPKEAQAILDQLKRNLSPAQLKAAEDAIVAWKPRPTALTIKARSGIEAANRLADSSGN